jgi:hypothetical protein
MSLGRGITGQNTFLTNGELLRYLTSGAAWIRDRRPLGVHLLQRLIDIDRRVSWRLSHPIAEALTRKASACA